MAALTARETLNRREIPRAAVATLSGCQPPEVSRYLKDPELVSDVRRARIEATIADLVLMLDALESSLPALFVLKPDWRDADSLRAIIRYTKDSEYRTEIDSGVASLGLKKLGATAPGAPAS